MELTLNLKRIKLNGKVVMWNEKDGGYKKHAGSVYFDNKNYTGFLNHNGMIELYRNYRKLGNYKPNNFVYC